MRWLAALVLMAPPLAAQEMAHCYTREAPADAPMTTVTPAPMSGFRDVLAIATTRRACGLGDDTALVEARIAKADCSPSSEIAAFSNEYMSQPPEDLRAELVSFLNLDEARFTAFCEALAPCEPGAEGYSEACIEAYYACLLYTSPSPRDS